MNKPDVTLANARTVDKYLASWIVHAALDPGNVEALVMDRGKAGAVIELRYRDGEGHGGLVYQGEKGEAFCLAAVEQSEPLVIKQRSAAQMAEACKNAQLRNEYERACVRFVRGLLYGVIPLVALIVLILAFVLWFR